MTPLDQTALDRLIHKAFNTRRSATIDIEIGLGIKAAIHWVGKGHVKWPHDVSRQVVAALRDTFPPASKEREYLTNEQGHVPKRVGQRIKAVALHVLGAFITNTSMSKLALVKMLIGVKLDAVYALFINVQ
eukprot:m.294084 g.294084  ORF g.294084 m.294084 type:complete len:131 (+) comp37907_c0_seq1:52-444(+)